MTDADSGLTDADRELILLVQTRTPERVRGRVLAVNSIFISCSNQLGAVESGWAAAFLGATTSVIAGGAATLLIVVWFTLGSRPLRHWKQGKSLVLAGE